MRYGDLGARFVAAVIDHLVASIIFYLIMFALKNVAGAIIGSFAVWLYFVLLEGSQWHATLGKKIMGLYVVDESGYGISFSTAILRGIGKIFSYMLGGIGYLMAIFNEEKQALHDMLAKTYVLSETSGVVNARPGRGSAGKRFDYEYPARKYDSDYEDLPELVCVKGPLAGMIYPLSTSGLAIGRDSVGCQVVLPSSQGKVSRVHCFLTYNPTSGMFVLNDRNSTHGTYLANGSKVSYSQPAALKSGDRFYLASPENTFEVR